jgi:hypothetical protein
MSSTAKSILLLRLVNDIRGWIFWLIALVISLRRESSTSSSGLITGLQGVIHKVL